MIVIIGGTGFIGKHLCCALTEARFPAVTFSHSPDIEFLKNHAPTIVGFRIDELRGGQHQEIIESATAIVYLASSSIPGEVENSVARELATNIRDVIDTCDRVATVNPKAHFIYLSSGGTVYGPGHDSAIPETAATNPTTPYAFGKVVIEKYFRYLSSTREVPHTILRAANPIGRWQQNAKQGFVGVALRRLREGNPITIYGDGDIVRDYFDVDDLCAAIITCIQKPELSSGQTWNVGSGQGRNLLQILEVIETATGQQLQRNHVPGRDNDLDFSVLDCRQIGSVLDWRCKKTLETTVNQIWTKLNHG